MDAKSFQEEIEQIWRKLDSSPDFRNELEELASHVEKSAKSGPEWTQPYVNATPIQEERV